MHFRKESLVFLCAVIAYGCPSTLHFPVDELECYSQEKIYHEESGKCYKLLTEGPCGDREWLVLEKPSPNERDPRIKAICAREKCEDGRYYWPKTRSCVEAKDKALLCAPEEELSINVFGEGECSCSREPPRVRLNGTCYQLYLQGPCRVGEVLVVRDNETPGHVCIEDKCHEESVRRKKNGNISKDAILAPFTNGSCYELGTRGPCENDQIYKVDSMSKQPDCTFLLGYVLSGVRQCPVDENGDCQKQITHKMGNKYLKELKELLKAE